MLQTRKLMLTSCHSSGLRGSLDVCGHLMKEKKVLLGKSIATKFHAFIPLFIHGDPMRAVYSLLYYKMKSKNPKWQIKDKDKMVKW